MPCAFGEPHDMQPVSKPYEEWLEEMVQEIEAERGYKVQAAMCSVCDYLGFSEADDEEDGEAVCIACNPDGEHEYHEAHVIIWQVGDKWIPSCSNRVLTWWDNDRAPALAGAPSDWIRPLP